MNLRRALIRLPLLLLRVPLRALPVAFNTVSLSIAQALLGTHRWKLLQLLITSANVVPALAALRCFTNPLLLTWAYGLGSRAFAQAHWRSLQFWKRVLPIYFAYKRTQISTRNAGPEEKTKKWNRRHEWGAGKVSTVFYRHKGSSREDG